MNNGLINVIAIDMSCFIQCIEAIKENRPLLRSMCNLLTL